MPDELPREISRNRLIGCGFVVGLVLVVAWYAIVGTAKPISKPEPVSKFTEVDAQNKVWEYRLTQDWTGSPNVPKGKTVFEFYLIRGKEKGITNLGWFVEEASGEGKYIVRFEEAVGFGDSQLLYSPRWEVTNDSIIALNGKARSITPDLIPEEKAVDLTGASELDQKIYFYFKELLAQYSDEVFIKYDEDPPRSKLDEAEERALRDTGDYFGITPQEAKEIFMQVLTIKLKNEK